MIEDPRQVNPFLMDEDSNPWSSNREDNEVTSDKLTLHDLVELEVRILERVAKEGPYRSPVKLAAEEWRGSEDWMMNTEVVQFVLYGLNEQGLVVLREHTHAIGIADWGIKIIYIRATPLAYDLLGLRKRPARLVGGAPSTRGYELALRPHDATEFRNHPEQAPAMSTIEICRLDEHCLRYPDHAMKHIKQLRDLKRRGVI